MDEQLKTKLIAYLDRLEGAAQTATEFASTEIPATIKEYLAWLLIERCTYALAFLPLIFVLYSTGRKMRDYATKREQQRKTSVSDIDEDFARIVGGVLRIAFIVPLLGVGYWGLQATKVAVAPRVVLLEKAGEIVGVRK